MNSMLFSSLLHGPKGQRPLAGGNAPGSFFKMESATKVAAETVHFPAPPSGRMFVLDLFRGRCSRLVAAGPSGQKQISETSVRFPVSGSRFDYAHGLSAADLNSECHEEKSATCEQGKRRANKSEIRIADRAGAEAGGSNPKSEIGP